MGKGRKVKCRATGEYGNSNDFYKTSKGYFKSEKIYKDFQKEADCRTKIISKLVEFFDYKKGQPLPHIILTELKKLEFYKNQIILKTIEQNHDAIEWACNHKTFKSDVGKGKYIFAIIKNKIPDVYKLFEAELKEEEELLKSLKESPSVENIDYDIPVQRQNNKDLSVFIGEEI